MVSNYPTTPVVFQAKPALPRKVNEPPDQLRRMERTFVTEHTHPLHTANAIKTLSPLTQKKGSRRADSQAGDQAHQSGGRSYGQGAGPADRSSGEALQ